MTSSLAELAADDRLHPVARRVSTYFGDTHAPDKVAGRVLYGALCAAQKRSIWDPFQPSLEKLFAELNARHFGGRVGPHRLFYFDAVEASLASGNLAAIRESDRTLGFRVLPSEVLWLVEGSGLPGEAIEPGDVPYIGLNLRLSCDDGALRRTLLHEMTHDAHDRHDAAFRAALLAAAPGEQWAIEECRRYELAETFVPELLRVLQGLPPGTGPWPDPLVQVREFIEAAGVTRDDVRLIVGSVGPFGRSLLLRAITR